MVLKFITGSGRRPPLIALVAGVAGMGMNCWLDNNRQRFLPVIGALAPICVLIGLAGLIDPRWYLAGEGRRRATPGWCRAVGVIVFVIGIGASVTINWMFYGAYFHL